MKVTKVVWKPVVTNHIQTREAKRYDSSWCYQNFVR